MASTSRLAVEPETRARTFGVGGLHRAGGIAALVEAALYLTAIVYFLVVLDFASVTDPAQMARLLVDNQTGLYVMNLLSYVVFGAVLVVLALALYDRLKADAPVTMQVATAFGLIWAGLVIASGMIANIGVSAVVGLYGTDPAQAATLWQTLTPVVDGLGGGNEVVGGVWTLLVSVAALRASAFHRAVNYLGIVVGAAGILSAIPALGEVGGGVFGLTQLVWFAALGVLMLRESPRT
ncbi:protein of unknown function [Halogranum rubrum]|uniref:DUF4386 family protein n=1 Tax=Halogranum rubrum TaxID=553466 RepID=A0A1I4H9V7_9EURY|nr:DUF4386 family protein [Halogranum rubrum]SFL39068.1 protein of unknown function [Halogranum rubrum]